MGEKPANLLTGSRGKSIAIFFPRSNIDSKVGFVGSPADNESDTDGGAMRAPPQIKGGDCDAEVRGGCLPEAGQSLSTRLPEGRVDADAEPTPPPGRRSR
jgi:hypothetical protein